MSESRARPLGGRLFHGSALTLASSLLSRGIAVVQSVVVARALDARQVGVFAIVTYVLGLLAAFADLGLPTAAAKLLAEARGAPGALRTVVTTLAVAMLGVAGLAGLLLLVLAAPLAALYAEPSLGGLFRLGALLLFLSLLGALGAGMLQGLQRIRRLAVAGVVKGLVTLAGIVLLVRPLGLAGILVASIVAELLVWPLVAGAVGRSVGPRADAAAGARAGAVVRRGVHVAVPVFLAGLLVWGGALFVRSYLAAALGYADVGYFQLADSLARVLVIVPTAVAVPLVPLVSESAAAGAAGTADLTRASLRVTLLTVLPLALLLHVAARPLVVLVYGGAYASAGPIAALMVLAAFFQALGVIAWSTLVGTGRVWAGFWIQSAGWALLAVLTLGLVPALGLAGLGVAHVAAAALTLALGLWYLARHLGVRLDALGALVPVCALGWLVAGGLGLAGQAGLVAAAVLAGGVLVLEWRALTPEEAGWVRAAARRVGLR
ncbi:MAG: hypothetical protein A3E31_02535 [Candidatus Rokubacteria bacterium RIFCSPHIGHO2_12_FULL_73_22]|nr:MAG: hypothetical protein A3E31_02535 [Candidatus Rokubacteria bacterium RIFCSPHIGHO2_12_FULL_73_22]OGL12219.1 MAG: hypothetical protein A3I14_01815 [Candidatus Rokubacteria bacterium RIFCSPLOWO2_02_FULL_73_56]OGL25625.1 MAG: hypothetical protein A3G44_03005 [Candidatus Rokubacteria bacterium RIFCSPLOWO2_12_FULL_73_47]